MPEIFRGAPQDSRGTPVHRGAWIAQHCSSVLEKFTGFTQK